MLWTLLLLHGGCYSPAAEVERPVRNVLPDVSGLGWIEGDRYLVVHDAKTPEEDDRPRVSIVEMVPDAAPGWTPLAVEWPLGGPPSHDLESIARIPGTTTYLLAESGDGGSAHQRLFVADLNGVQLTIHEAAEWPVPVYDVEGTAVVRFGETLYYVFAERAHGERATEFVWGRLELDPLRLEDVRTVTFENPLKGRDTRAVSAVEVDRDRQLYVAAAFDPDRDEGPFRSAVWEVGRFVERAGDGVDLVLYPEPTRLATLGGLKAEGLAVAEHTGRAELVVGTDDENFGGTMRRLP